MDVPVTTTDTNTGVCIPVSVYMYCAQHTLRACAYIHVHVLGVFRTIHGGHGIFYGIAVQPSGIHMHTYYLTYTSLKLVAKRFGHHSVTLISGKYKQRQCSGYLYTSNRKKQPDKDLMEQTKTFPSSQGTEQNHDSSNNKQTYTFPGNPGNKEKGIMT